MIAHEFVDGPRVRFIPPVFIAAEQESLVELFLLLPPGDDEAASERTTARSRLNTTLAMLPIRCPQTMEVWASR
ncbi:MAG: hypothetical protein R6V75_03530 [Bacteroidales bacterium]